MDRIGRLIKELVPQRPRRRRFYVYSSLALAVMLAAWLFSALPPNASQAQSGWLMAFISKFLGVEVGELLLRKLAHFTEYLVLGTFMGLGITQLGRRERSFLVALGLALPAAVIDETIQVFSGRGPSIIDVWIDVAGAAAGLLITRLFAGRRPDKRRTAA